MGPGRMERPPVRRTLRRPFLLSVLGSRTRRRPARRPSGDDLGCRVRGSGRPDRHLGTRLVHVSRLEPAEHDGPAVPAQDPQHGFGIAGVEAAGQDHILARRFVARAAERVRGHVARADRHARPDLAQCRFGCARVTEACADKLHAQSVPAINGRQRHPYGGRAFVAMTGSESQVRRDACHPKTRLCRGGPGLVADQPGSGPA